MKSLIDIVSGILSIGIGLPLLFVAIINLMLFEYHPNRKFNIESWHENVTERYEMRKDLIKGKYILNKSKNQIVNTIGLPSGKVDLTTDTLSNWRYYLGYRGWGFGIKIYYLDVEFEQGKSKFVEITEIID